MMVMTLIVIRDKNDGKLRVIDIITNVEKWQNPECTMMEMMTMMMIIMIMIMYDDGDDGHDHDDHDHDNQDDHI